jgi:hypothetical protein
LCGRVRPIDADKLGNCDDHEAEGDKTRRDGAMSLEEDDPKYCQYNAGALGEKQNCSV